MAPPEAKLWVALAQGGKSRANVGDAGGRVFDVTEVTSAVMRVDEMQVVIAGLLRLAKNVDAVLRSYAGRGFAAEKSDAGRRLDARCAVVARLPWLQHGLARNSSRRRARFGDPVERGRGEQKIAIVAVVEVAIAVAPGLPALHQPGELADRRIVQRVRQGLRL